MFIQCEEGVHVAIKGENEAISLLMSLFTARTIGLISRRKRATRDYSPLGLFSTMAEQQR